MNDIIKRLWHTIDEPSIGDILHFSATGDSAVASYHYRQWQLVRLFDGKDGRRYVRLVSTADRTITKVLLVDALLDERFTAQPGEIQDIDDSRCRSSVPQSEPPLPLRSRRARAAVRRRSASAAE
jgi:hypothetical protein